MSLHREDSTEHPLPSVPEHRQMDDANPTWPPPPSPLITRRNRRLSISERAALTPQKHGTIKYFCRQRGHGYITPNTGGDDVFVHITDIDGEYVPHQGDKVAYKECPCPPKFEKFQAIHVVIENLAPGERHERWDEPPEPHAHPHPKPNIEATRSPQLNIPQ